DGDRDRKPDECGREYDRQLHQAGSNLHGVPPVPFAHRAIIPRMTYEHGTTAKRLPSWMRRPLAVTGEFDAVTGLLGELELHTVCAEAKCPNRGECFASGTATFLVAGDACTRGCRFCAVETQAPLPLDVAEPARVAEAVARLGLKHAVVTMV